MLKFGRGVAKLRIPIIILSILLLIPAALGYLNTRVNYDILYYLPDDIETMQGQDILLQDFGKGAYALFIVNGMSDADAARVKAQVEAVDHVAQVVWFDTFADDTIPQEMLPDSIYSVFHSDNGTLMAIFFDEGTSSDGTMDAIEEIRTIAGEQCFLSSMSAICVDTRNLINQQLFWYVLVAVVLSAVVLAVTMDSFMAPLLFLLTIGMAIVYNLGTNFIRGEISFITMSLTAVLQLAVTMDYSIFLWNTYREARKEFPDKQEAMAHAIRRTITSVAGSSLTTIAGFIALCFMSFTLGLDLGIVMAKGVVLGVICCVTVLPALILVSDRAITKTQHKPLNIKGEKFAGFVVKHHRIIAILLLLLWIPAIYGYHNMQVYYNLDSSLPEYLPSVQANEQLDADYDMSSIYMILCDRDMSAADARAMLDELQDVDGINFALGAASLLPAGVAEDFVPDELSEQLTGGDYQLMLLSSAYAVASDEVNAQCDAVNEIIKRYDPNAMLIGEAPCTKDLIEITDHDFAVVTAVSIGAIFILILLVLKSFSLPAILVLVIELAIYINLGICWYTGTVESFISSIVIGTIQLGATVDYAILMTNRYQYERQIGRPKEEAARIALTASMPSVITSALGFFAATIGVGIYSDVDLIGAICLLLGRGALISMALVLLLLPSLYLIFDGLIMRTGFGKNGRKAARIQEGSNETD